MLEATDEEILEWLLVDALADEDEHAANDPIAALQRALRENPAGMEKVLDAVRNAPLPVRAKPPGNAAGSPTPARLPRAGGKPVRP